VRDTDWRPSPCPKCGKMRAAAEHPVCDCKGDRAVNKIVFVFNINDLPPSDAPESRSGFTHQLDALLALKEKEAFAGSCDPETAAARRAVFRQAREDFIFLFGGPK
jgi:hypothetical protein